MRRPDFRRYENIAALDARRVQSFADLPLIVVHFRRVDVTIAEPQRLLDEASTTAPAQLPSPEAQEGNAGAIGGDIRAGRPALLRVHQSRFQSHFQSHLGACGGLTIRESGRLSLPISAISASLSLKSRLSRFSASRSVFDVRGIGMMACCSRKRSATCDGVLPWVLPIRCSVGSAGTLPRASGQ